MNSVISEQVTLLRSGSPAEGYRALQLLEQASRKDAEVYPYMDRFIEMTGDRNSYIRTRGLILAACNARWDTDGKIDRSLPDLLIHITDPKPVTARKCVNALAMIGAHKPRLRDAIIQALEEADISCYADTMRPLVAADIRQALTGLRAQEDPDSGEN